MVPQRHKPTTAIIQIRLRDQRISCPMTSLFVGAFPSLMASLQSLQNLEAGMHLKGQRPAKRLSTTQPVTVTSPFEGAMDILYRFLTQTFRENMDELHRSEMLKRQLLMIARDIHLA